MIQFLVLTVFALASVTCQDNKPTYSSRYANVHYQRGGKGTSVSKTKFDSSLAKQGIYPPATEGTYIENSTGFNELNPPVDLDTSTEQDSEQIEFGRRIMIKKKLESTTKPTVDQIEFGRRISNKVKYADSERLELIEEFEPTQEPETTIEEVTEPVKVSELSQQGSYYIYHPNGLLQKILYTTRNDEQNMEYFARLNYQNIVPVVAPIYSYDSSTVAFQRLLFP